MESITAATEKVTRFDSMPKGGMAAANQLQAASATRTAPVAARREGVKILAFAGSTRRRM